MNNYKLKHLAKFCCRPQNETEFEAVKMASELGGVAWYDGNEFPDKFYPYLVYKEDEITGYSKCVGDKISCLDFIRKLRMTEEEARELEDDRVVFDIGENWAYIDGSKAIEAFDGHHFRVSEDGKTVTLHKEKQ